MEHLDYQRVMFNSIICTNKRCKVRRVYINKDEIKENIQQVGSLNYYTCECGEEICFKY